MKPSNISIIHSKYIGKSVFFMDEVSAAIGESQNRDFTNVRRHEADKVMNLSPHLKLKKTISHS